MASFQVPHRRPQSLSDPSGDFPRQRLAQLLATPDAALNWRDFQCLFGPFTPAGTYEESAYFLPLAFDCLLADDEHASDLAPSLVWFASQYAADLDRDRCLEPAREQLRKSLSHWSADFFVVHFNQEACLRRGIALPYFDLVRHSLAIRETTRELVRFRTHADLAAEFFADLASSDNDAVKSAWFLEMARANASREAVPPPTHRSIRHLLEDRRLIEHHAAIVWEQLPGGNADVTYWNDTFALLRRQ